ncbi:hypothetical protein ACHAXH_003840 [Discostella pseudostelligera]
MKSTQEGSPINVDGESTQSPHDALTTNNNNSNEEGLFDTSSAADYNIENRAMRAEDQSFVIDDDDVFLDDTIIEVTYTSTPPPTKRPTRRPTRSPTRRPTTTTSNPACVTLSTYDAIDADIANLKNNIADAKSRSHFLGGIVRLAAHDFMDYDRNTPSNPMGPDGCFDVSHASNNGLSSIWCSTCPLTLLHKQKYSQISKADFWIAAANAVIRQTSVNNALNLRSTFRWGRKDASSCSGSGTRLPTPTGCTSVQNTFLTRMGLSWRDTAVLMGGHTLGRGDSSFSGHHGIWEDTDTDAQRFDKQYFEEIYLNSWRPRNSGTSLQDWTTGRPGSTTTRMMLNTDLCLVYDIPGNNLPCCTRTGVLYPNGDDTCIEAEAAARKCPVLSASHSRYEARQTVGEMLGGSFPNSNNVPFYSAFTESWNKATTLGQSNLSLLKSTRTRGDFPPNLSIVSDC